MEDLSAFSARPRLAALLDHFAEITDARRGWKVMYPLRLLAPWPTRFIWFAIDCVPRQGPVQVIRQF
jgi:hypothetical protein